MEYAAYLCYVECHDKFLPFTTVVAHVIGTHTIVQVEQVMLGKRSQPVKSSVHKVDLYQVFSVNHQLSFTMHN